MSILLLCWNHASYLQQCIAVLAAQTDRDFEVVFLDNASSDGSFELASALFQQHSLPATMLRNAAPAAISANFNRLLAAAGGQLIAPLSTDDWYDPNYVAAVRTAAAVEPDAGWFACGGRLFVERTGETRPIANADHRGGWVLPDLLEGRNPFNFVGCCYRRHALDSVGGWDEQMPVEDRDLFVRLAQRFQVALVRARLVTYRLTGTGASANPAFMAQAFRLFFAKHRTLFGATYREQVGRMLAMNGSVAVDRGEFGLARRLLLGALRHSPGLGPAWRGLFYLLRARLASRPRR